MKDFSLLLALNRAVYPVIFIIMTILPMLFAFLVVLTLPLTLPVKWLEFICTGESFSYLVALEKFADWTVNFHLTWKEGT